MFENIENILMIIYFKNFNNLNFLDDLLKDNIIPIGTVMKNHEIIDNNNNNKIEDILPCLIYKENYKA